MYPFLAQCIENAHENEPTAEEASSLPQNIEVDILKVINTYTSAYF